jgi:TonB family protein
MTSAVPQNDRLIFGELLDNLRQHGFRIGLDHYLRLQTLLDKIEGRCAPDELRTLLCPIFATSKSQQEQFYRIFDSYFDMFESAPEITEVGETVETEKAAPLLQRPPRRKWPYVLVPIAAAIAIIIFAALLLRTKQSEQNAADQRSATNVPQTAASPASIREQTGAKTTAVPPSVATNERQATPAPTPQSTPQPAPEPNFYERNQNIILFAIILLPLLVLLVYEWHAHARRHLLLQKQQTRKPPFVWPLQLPSSEQGVYDSEQFYTAARSFRRRQTDEFLRLDVEATVSATVEALGFPNLRYKSDSRVPEYLILIDRASYLDHQARLFDELVKELESEGVFLTRYFYDTDPRVCRNEQSAQGVSLNELQSRFANHRLLVFGNGAKLINPVSGWLESWTAIFNHWQDRALLTVEDTSRWGLTEVALAQSFIVLPASLSGLLAVVDYFESTVPADVRSWKNGQGNDADSAALTPQSIVAQLRRSLGEDTFQWLSACAVYPELHWDLTLHLGALSAMPAGLITEANLLKLIRLPWFRTGTIPDELRWLLINQLPPLRQQAVRASIVEMLEKNAPPVETFAGDQYRLNLFAQRWLESRSRRRLRELLELMKRLPQAQVVRDTTLIRYLESTKWTPLDFILPDRLRALFYHRGVPAFGLKTGARLVAVLLLTGGMWIGIKALNPTRPGTLDKSETAASVTPISNESDENSSPQVATDSSNNQNQESGTTQEALPLAADDKKQKDTQGKTEEPAVTVVAPTTSTTSSETNRTIPLPGVSVRTGDLTPQGGSIFSASSGNPSGTSSTTIQDEPPPPLTTQSPAGERAPQRPGPPVTVGDLARRVVKSLPKPEYPAAAAAQRAGGKVIVQLVVDETGNVVSARAVKGDPLLQDAAIKAASRAHFNPLIVNGQPTRMTGQIVYDFKLPPEQNPMETDRIPGRQPGGGGRRPPE